MDFLVFIPSFPTKHQSIRVKISFDISQQLGYGALASGVMVAASQAAERNCR